MVSEVRIGDEAILLNGKVIYFRKYLIVRTESATATIDVANNHARSKICGIMIALMIGHAGTAVLP